MTAATLLLSAALHAGAAQGDGDVRISMVRTACFGTCAVYSVEMRGDGSVVYSGTQNVRVDGTHTWKVDAAAVRALASEMQKAGFFEMKDAYSAPVTDLPTTHVTLAAGGRTKAIRDYFGAPPALKEIEARIDTVSGARGYVSVNRAAVRDMQAKGWRATGRDADRWMTRALYAGDADTVRALLEAGMSARAADEGGVTLVMKAAMSGDPDTVRAVLAAGGDPTARDRWGRNAADRARDGLRDDWSVRNAVVGATGRPRDYALILKLLTDE